MANTNLLSFQITDGIGGVGTVPLYFPTGMTLANIQAGSDAFAPLLDACIDGKITAASVQLNLTLPSGLKGSAAGDKRIGALLAFDAANTAYRHSMFVPTWESAGFTGNVVSSGSPYDDFIAAVLAGTGTGGSELKPSDRYANDVVAFLEGLKKTRK